MAADVKPSDSEEADFIFLNHAAVAPISGPAAKRLRDYAEQASSRSYVGADWYGQIPYVRRQAAKLICADGEHEIAFIPNTSTGLNLVARGLEWKEGDEVVTTDAEYPANRYPWEDLQRQGVRLRTVEEDAAGRIPAEAVINAVNRRTRLVALSHVQYASGYRMNLRPIAEAIHRVGGHLCVDAIQSVGVVPLDVKKLGIDFLSADGHKWLLSPEGCGVFYCRAELIEKLHPAVIGWLNMVAATDFDTYRFELQPDARRFEPGTHNVPGILALGASIDLLLETGMPTVWQQVETLTSRLCLGLERRGYRVYSPRAEGESSGIVAVDPPAEGENVEALRGRLASRGIVAAARRGHLRISPHFYNTAQQIDRLLAALD